MKPTTALHWRIAKLLTVVGTLASNWWLLVPWLSGIVDPRLGLFSDLEVAGAAHSSLFRGLDLLAASSFLVALLLRWPSMPGLVRRPEFSFLIAFCVAEMMGALSPYVCAESTYATCRQLEWHLQLPGRHYLHIVAGVAEFFFLTVAAWLMFKRTRTSRDVTARSARAVIWILGFAYPALAVVYLADRFGAFVEPVFVLTFCAVVALEVFERPLTSTGQAPVSGMLGN